MHDSDTAVEDDFKELSFNHPFTPYDVQEKFMRTVYNVLQTGNGQIGILESPTGTVSEVTIWAELEKTATSGSWNIQPLETKTKRLTPGHFKSSRYEASLQTAGDEFKDEPSWLIDQLLRRKRDELLRTWEDREKRLEAARLREKAHEDRGRKRRRLEEPSAGNRTVEDEDAEWLLDDWDPSNSTGQSSSISGLSKETQDVLASIGLGDPKKQEEHEDLLNEDIKIYYTSRTHSQLSQFIGELRRPVFPPSLPKSLAQEHQATAEPVKLLPLSSRQRLCINPSVARLGSVQAINDRCAELQQPKASKKCPYLPKEELMAQTHQFRDNALGTIPDIEDLHLLGKSLAVCPYYASRTALPGAEIITLPYPLLLQKSARDALGVKLEGNVVVIDEAHNIMDAVSNVHAAELRLSELRKGRGMLGIYVKKFGKKLKGKNRVNVGRIGRVMEGLLDWMQDAIQFRQESGIVDVNDLTRRKGIDQINLFELMQYIQTSKLAYKIEGYASHIESDNDVSKPSPKIGSPVLHTLVSFLIALTNLSFEGRIFYQKLNDAQPDLQLTYLLLSPTHAFSSVASTARAVILAGGTMSPFDDYKQHLFPSLPDSKITTLSCGHVIPPENLCVWTLASSRLDAPPFEFSFQRRGDSEMITQLGLAILNTCSIVPDGVVAFFPSYGYLDEVVRAWQQPSGPKNQSIWNRLETRKALFRESKGGDSDDILQQYSEAVLGENETGRGRGVKGALLLSVIGGKMSEGINFSDRLGRCVIVIGLPYPNIASADWKAKIEYIETTTTTSLSTQGVARDEALRRGKLAAREFYENACMRAVNQSIGRAIRHRGDYAAIVLVDKRYGTDRIRGKLPGWIHGGLVKESHEKGLGGLMGALGGFFKAKKTTTT
ncbi:chromosome transmission fidelity 1 [Paramyrothecium foliicola]|nr:chromosome transmission fidelity 1 [Paramyrothecium foliicola]